MIIFDGTKEKGNVWYFLFRNEHGTKIEIPTDKRMVQHFLLYFDLLSKKEVEPAKDVVE
jgi:hypothetical protein